MRRRGSFPAYLPDAVTCPLLAGALQEHPDGGEHLLSRAGGSSTI
jgi:hypothetical protein